MRLARSLVVLGTFLATGSAAVLTAGAVVADDGGAGLPPPAAHASAAASSAGSIVRGIDVSKYQGAIDWTRVAQSGIRFAFERAGDGFYHDPRFAENWSGSKAAGLLRGAYHFFRASHDGAAQANDFLDQIPAGDLGELPPVADVETLDGVSARTLAAELEKWISTVESRTGRTPIVYTSPGLWDGWHMPSFASEPLWVAHWSVSRPRVPHGWSDWTFWQYRNDASVPGISNRVDADEFRGTIDDLQAFAASHGGSAPAATAPAAPATTAPAATAPGGAAPAPATIGLAGALGAATGATDPSSPASPSTGSGDPLLRQGSAGENVRRAQTILHRAGSDLAVDGVFGPETERAVREFQRTHGCKVDGIVGPETWGALERVPE